MKPHKVIVIGGGPAGMMATITAANNLKYEIILIEKNTTLARKMSITGGGRCNITNTCDVPTLLQKVQRNPRFLYSALNTFTSNTLLDILSIQGLKTKVEDNGRVFPVSNKSGDVIGAFKKYLQKDNIQVMLGTTVLSIKKQSEKFVVVTNKHDQSLLADKIILCTGGLSAPATGSTGCGYNFAKQFGHRLTSEFFPSVVPLTIKESFVKELQGTSLKDIGVTMYLNNKQIFKDVGDMIFTHFGVSGPVMLRASAHIAKRLSTNPIIFVDMFPNTSLKEFDEKLLHMLKNNANKNIKTVLEEILQTKLAQVLLSSTNIKEDIKSHSITKDERLTIVDFIKNLKLTVMGNVGFNSAIATAGGIVTKEINPSTMESKIIPNLYFTSELIDVNAYTGGYNLQIAFSTGYVAGLNASKSIVN